MEEKFGVRVGPHSNVDDLTEMHMLWEEVTVCLQEFGQRIGIDTGAVKLPQAPPIDLSELDARDDLVTLFPLLKEAKGMPKEKVRDARGLDLMEFHLWTVWCALTVIKQFCEILEIKFTVTTKWDHERKVRGRRRRGKNPNMAVVVLESSESSWSNTAYYETYMEALSATLSRLRNMTDSVAGDNGL